MLLYDLYIQKKSKEKKHLLEQTQKHLWDFFSINAKRLSYTLL